MGELERQFYCYAVLGAIGTVENAVVLVCLLMKQRLRKRYILICGLAGGDLLISLGFLIGGAWRINIIHNKEQDQNVTAIVCMTCRPYTWLYIVGDPLQNLIVLAIALERFLATYMPVKYYHWPTRKYSFYAVCLVYGFTAFLLAISFIHPSTTAHGKRIVNTMCFTRDGTGQAFLIFSAILCAVAGCLAICIYIGTIAVLKRTTVQLVSVRKQDRASKPYQHFLARQIRITKLMAVIIVFSFFFVVIPEILSFGLSVSIHKHNENKTDQTLNEKVVPWLGILVAIMAVVNPWLYTLGSKELRVEVWRNEILVSCFKKKVLSTLYSIRSQTDEASHASCTEKCDGDDRQKPTGDDFNSTVAVTVTESDL